MVEMKLWADEAVAFRAASGGAHDYVARGYYRMNHFDGSQDDVYRPDDYRCEHFMESDRAERARILLTGWLVNEYKLFKHARWVAKQNPAHPAEALFTWLDQLLYGNGRTAVRSHEIVENVQLVADTLARADMCKMDWAAVAKELKPNKVPAEPLA